MCKDKCAETEFDLCIVGAGMFGCAAARHASAHPTLRVCLIGLQEPTAAEERRDIRGAHHDEGRIVPSLEATDEYQVLTRQSLDRFAELERLSGIKFYTPSGLLLLFERFHPDVSQILKSMKSGHPRCVDLSTADIFHKRFPFLAKAEKLRAFLDDMGAGHISPRKMIAAQKRVAEMQSCHILHDIVLEVKEPQDGMHQIVTGRHGVILSKRVLLCPGAFLNFNKLLPRNLKVTLRKETAVFLRIPEEEAVRLRSMPAVIGRDKGPHQHPHVIGFYILPPIKYDDGMHYLKIGHIGEITDSDLGSLQEVREWYNSEGDPDVVRFYSTYLQQLLPGVRVEEVRGRTCVTSDSPTGLPYIDRLTPTLTVAAVGNSRGAAMCEEVGRLAAHLSITGHWDSPQLSRNLFQALYQ